MTAEDRQPDQTDEPTSQPETASTETSRTEQREDSRLEKQSTGSSRTEQFAEPGSRIEITSTDSSGDQQSAAVGNQTETTSKSSSGDEQAAKAGSQPAFPSTDSSGDKQPAKTATASSNGEPQKSSSPGTQREGIGKTFGLVAVLSFLSKFLGLARDMVILGAFGKGADPFYFASLFTNNILVLFGGQGGPFHSTTVSILSARKSEATTHALVGQLVGVTFAGLSVAAALLWIFAPQAVAAVIHAEQLSVPERLRLWSQVVLLLRIMSPLVVIAGLVGVGAGISNSYKEFFWPSLAPAVANVAVISAVAIWLVSIGAADLDIHSLVSFTLSLQRFILASNTTGATLEVLKIFLFMPLGGLVFLATGALAGAIGQLFVQLPGMFRARPAFSDILQIQPGMKEFLLMLGPAAVATTVGQINVYIDGYFVSSLQQGSMSAIVNANRLLQLPLGVILTAMLVPILPRFTEQVAAGELDGMKKELSRSIRIVWFLVIPLATMLLALPEPIIKLLFERGQFDAQLRYLIVTALMFLVPQAFFYIPRDLVTRAFYAHQDSATPFRVGLCAIAVKFAANYILVIALGWGVGGITLSTTLVTIFNMAVLSLLLRRKIGALGITRMIRPAAIMLVAAGLAGILAHYTQLLIASSIPARGAISGTVALFLSLAVAGVLGLGFYGLVCLWLKLDEPRLALEKLRKHSLFKKLGI